MRYFCETDAGKHYVIIDRDDGSSAFVECASKFDAMTKRDTAQNMNAWGFDAKGEPDATRPPHMLPDADGVIRGPDGDNAGEGDPSVPLTAAEIAFAELQEKEPQPGTQEFEAWRQEMERLHGEIHDAKAAAEAASKPPKPHKPSKNHKPQKPK